MKINSTRFEATNNKPIMLNRIRVLFLNSKLKLKTLLKDVFEKKGTEMNSLPQGREFPNSIGTEKDIIPKGGGSYIKFFKEDIEKMKSMTTDEKLAYKENLINEGKYQD